MDTFTEDILSFELRRINTAVTWLRENDKNYNEKQDEYRRLTIELFKDLKEDKVILFDKIIDLLGSISGDEMLLVYRTAFKDAFNFQDNKYFCDKEGAK